MAEIFRTHVLKRALVMSEGEKTAVVSDSGLRITALTIDQTAKILSSAGGRRIGEEMIRADIDAGAPTNPDGTLNLVRYTSWLVREVASHAD